MTRRAYLVLFLAAICLASGLIIRHGGLVALSLPFLTYLLAAALYRPEDLDLTSEQQLETRHVLSGQELKGALTLTCAGKPIEELTVSLTPPAGLNPGQNAGSTRFALKPGQADSISFMYKGPRGEYHIPYPEAVWSDTFGVFEDRKEIHISNVFSILAPQIKLAGLRIRPPHTRGFAGPIPSRKAGAGLDFLTVREYQTGDSLRHINWKRTSRTDQDMFTNTFEQQRIADVGILLDARQMSDLTVNGQRLFEHSVNAAGAISEELIHQGNRVGLLVYGASIISAFPAMGKRQLEKIRRTLARAQTGFSYALEKLEYLPVRFFLPRSQIIVISPVNSSDIGVLSSLAHKGYAVLIVSPNPVLMEFDPSEVNERQKLALRAALAERKLNINLLRRSGVEVLDWDVSTPLSSLLQVYQPASLKTR